MVIIIHILMFVVVDNIICRIFESILQYAEFFSLGTMSRTGPSEQARVNGTTILRFKGDGWSADIADSFQQKEKITVPTNKEMITEV